MKKRLLYFLLPIFALTGLLFAPQPTFAEPIPTSPDTTLTSPDDSTTTDTTETTPETSTQKPTTDASCYDQVGGVGWLVCPFSGFLAKGIDALYGIIEGWLQVTPISTDHSSPIYLVWEYIRNITNIVFIIFLLIVVFSQLTDIGITNYGIKRVLPRIVIAAILVNLSYIICALAVDVSNIVGNSLGAVFTNIYTVATAGETITYSAGQIAATIIGGIGIGSIGVVGGLAIAGGGLAALMALIPVIFAGFIAVITAFLTMAARQALIIILVMIAPLAFVAYLLPNTEKWFQKWKDLLLQMLVFYPMFAFLFGASQLASWVIISSSGGNIFTIILGIAVQILPLFFALSLMKMSRSILGSISTGIQKLSAPAQRGVTSLAAERAAAHKAEFVRKGLMQPRIRAIDPKTWSGAVKPSYWAGALTNYQANTRARREQAEKDSVFITSENINARKLGKDIIGRKKDGTPIYSKKPIRVTAEMRDELAHRTRMLHAKNSENELNEKMGAMSGYLTANNIDTTKRGSLAAKIKHLSDLQGENYLVSMDIQRAIAANDLSDKRYYFSKVRDAASMDENTIEYQNRILHAAGAEAYDDDINIRTNAIMSVKAGAYDMFEQERKAITAKYNTYLTTQVTKEVLHRYDDFLKTKNIDGIVAAQTILDIRGDHDAMRARLLEHMKENDFLLLGEDFTSRLALNLLGMTGKDPFLGRLGKHLNKQTWRYTDDKEKYEKGLISLEDMRPQAVTSLEYVAGIMSNGKKLPRDGLIRLLSGTSLKDVDRNAMENIMAAIKFVEQAYAGQTMIDPDDPTKQIPIDFKDLNLRENAVSSIMPQIVTALPTFESGGEQIRNMLSFLTDGAKYNEDDKVWTGTTSRLGLSMTEKYLSSLTPNDVIGFKSDAFEAVKYTLIQHYGDEARAKAKFKQIIVKSGALKKLLTGDPSALNPMKKPVKEWLDLLDN